MKIIESKVPSQTDFIKPIKRYNDKICLSTKDTNFIIKKTDISYLKSDSSYCEIHINDGVNHLCSKTMKEIYSRIQSQMFFKVHHSYVINLENIKSLDSSYTYLTLEDDTQIPISRTRKKLLKELIQLKFD